MQPRSFGKIFVEADSPKFIENDIQTATEFVDLNTLNVADLLTEYRKRQANFDATPFDPEGHDLRFFPGGYTVWSGFPGAGKTTLLRQFVCHLMRADKKVFIASLEENPMDVFYRLACVALGTEEPTESGLQSCVDAWHDKLRLWSYRRGVASHARILAVIRVLAKEGVRHAIIDSLARLDVHSGDWEAQRLFANAMEATCATSGTHIHLVAHPRKLVSADQDPDINDVAGSADIGRLSDNVLFIRRADNDANGGGEFTGMHIHVRKQRYHTGACPTIKGYYSRRMKQYKPHMHDIEITQYLPKEAYR